MVVRPRQKQFIITFLRHYKRGGPDTLIRFAFKNERSLFGSAFHLQRHNLKPIGKRNAPDFNRRRWLKARDHISDIALGDVGDLLADNLAVRRNSKKHASSVAIEKPASADGIFFEPASQRVYVFSHSAPNATVINPEDGAVAGTIDLGGAPEQAASDGKGHLYVDLEDKNKVAVVDVNTLKVTAQYELGEKGDGPAGLGIDAKNHILFAFCHSRNCVILNADDGKIITTLPIGNGTDGGGFNPATMEAFSSQGDGTLSIIKETSPTTFEVAQTVKTKSRAKTCTLDTKKNQIVLITTEPLPGAAATNTPSAQPEGGPGAERRGGPGGDRRGGPGGPGGRGNNGPSLLDIIVVGR